MAYIGGAGIPLQFPFNNYGFQPTGGSNRFSLAGGTTFVIPSGKWWISAGIVGFIQFLDPVSGIWQNYNTISANAPVTVDSDGYNFRVANLTGTLVGALITTNGTGYTSAPVVTASAGGSTWIAIVGGALNASVNTAGTGYTLPPLVVFPSPPIGGIQATGTVALTGSTITSVTMVNQGAGYITAPVPVIIPNPLDPNLSGITAGKLTATLTGAGTVTAVVCTYGGTVQTTLPTLAFASSSGTGAAATAVGCYTVTGSTVTVSGVGYVAGTYPLTSAGGYTTAAPGTVVNPELNTLFFRVRQLQATSTATVGATAVPVIIDGGMFQNTSATAAYLAPSQVTAPTTQGTFALTFGGAPTAVVIQAM